MSKTNQSNKETINTGTDMTQEQYDRNPTRMYMNGHITRRQWERMMRAELELAIARMRMQG